MEIRDLVTTDSIVANLKATSKKQALQMLAAHAATICGQHERAIFDVLMERERLGTTGVGNGIAIPHGKLPTLETLFGVFARLEKPVDYQAIDERPPLQHLQVGIVFACHLHMQNFHGIERFRIGRIHNPQLRPTALHCRRRRTHIQ